MSWTLATTPPDTCTRSSCYSEYDNEYDVTEYGVYIQVDGVGEYLTTNGGGMRLSSSTTSVVLDETKFSMGHDYLIQVKAKNNNGVGCAPATSIACKFSCFLSILK